MSKACPATAFVVAAVFEAILATLPIRVFCQTSTSVWVSNQNPEPSELAPEPIDIGTRRELFVDRLLVQSLTDARLELHHPQPAETVIKFDQAWEGPFCGYITVIKDGDIYRMYSI